LASVPTSCLVDAASGRPTYPNILGNSVKKLHQVALTILVSISPAQGDAQAAVKLSPDEVRALAAIHVALNAAVDSADVELARARNKTPDAQKEERDKLKVRIAQIMAKANLSSGEFERRRFFVSTDNAARATFDSAVAKITGAPLPGSLPAAPAGAAPAAAPVAVPAGPVGVHLGHVVNAFSDTPNGAGLLATAFTEARIAIQHAELGARNTTNLDQMKLHAGHVIHAVDPTVVTQGPGRGYGVKKAVNGVIAHTELAAKSEGASANVTTHARHITTAARTTLSRADEVIAMAERVRAATTAQEAAGSMAQLVSLAQQLVAGRDANADGLIRWEDPEGGLQQAQEHVNLLLAAEKK
jgi:hypothetical protein